METNLTPAQLKMLKQAFRGESPVAGKRFVGKRKINMQLLQKQGYLNGHVITDKGRAALG